MSIALKTFCVTIMLFARTSTTSRERRESVTSMSVSRRQALCVWPVTNRSTDFVVRPTMSTIGPEMPLQSLIPPGCDCTPPSWSRTTIARTP